MKTTFVLEHRLTKPASVVVNYLTDMQQFVSVHPLIYKAEKVAVDKHLVYERVTLLGIPLRFTYVVTVSGDGQNNITYKTTVNKMVHVEMHFEIQTEKTATVVRETIKINSFLPVHGFMKWMLRRHHGTMFANIENCLNR